MLCSLRGMCSNWLPQCSLKSTLRLSTVAINRSYKQPRNHNTRLAVVISISQINSLTTSETEMETKPLRLYWQECCSRILENRVLTMGNQIRAKPPFILFHSCAQVKQQNNQKSSLATVDTSHLSSLTNIKRL